MKINVCTKEIITELEILTKRNMLIRVKICLVRQKIENSFISFCKFIKKYFDKNSKTVLCLKEPLTIYKQI